MSEEVRLGDGFGKELGLSEGTTDGDGLVGEGLGVALAVTVTDGDGDGCGFFFPQLNPVLLEKIKASKINFILFPFVLFVILFPDRLRAQYGLCIHFQQI